MSENSKPEIRIENGKLMIEIETIEAIETKKIVMGQFYESNFGDIYILAQTGRKKVSLISLNTGNRWKDAVDVKHVSNISPDEWNKICDGNKFKRIV